MSTFGCGSGDVELFLGFPQLDGARSMVLAVPENGALTLYGASIGGSNLRVNVEYAEGEAIQALIFERTLEELRLSEGALENPVPGDDEGVLGLLEPVRSFAARVDAERGVVDWVEDPATDARDAHYKKARSTCATFLAPRTLGTIPGALSFAFPVDDTHALLGTRSGVLAIASQDGLTTIQPPIPGYVRGAFSDGTKVYLSEWFSPRMYRGDPSPVAGAVNIEPLPDSPLPMGAYALAGGDGKIIAASEEGQAAWFDGTSWKSLPSFSVNDSLVRASWTPEESFYWSRGGGGLTRVDPSGAPTAENFEAGVYSIEAIDELGTVLGTEDGKLFKRAMLGWGGLGGDYGWWTVDLESYAGGFFFLLASGSVGQYRVDPDAPLCPDQLVATYLNDGRIVRMGRSLIIAGWDANLPTDVYYVEF